MAICPECRMLDAAPEEREPCPACGHPTVKCGFYCGECDEPFDADGLLVCDCDDRPWEQHVAGYLSFSHYAPADVLAELINRFVGTSNQLASNCLSCGSVIRALCPSCSSEMALSDLVRVAWRGELETDLHRSAEMASEGYENYLGEALEDPVMMLYSARTLGTHVSSSLGPGELFVLELQEEISDRLGIKKKADAKRLAQYLVTPEYERGDPEEVDRLLIKYGVIDEEGPDEDEVVDDETPF